MSELVLTISLGALLLAVLFLLLWRVLREPSQSGRVGESLIRLEARLEDLARTEESRARVLADELRELDRSLREHHANVKQDLERRLGDVQSQQAVATGDLRTYLGERFEALRKEVANQLADGRTQTVRSLGDLREQLQTALVQHQSRFEQRHGEAIKTLQDTLYSGMQSVQKQVLDALSRSSEELGKRVEGLTNVTDERLKDISGEVEKRLAEGFEKTTATFADVLKRLALIDEAQKKITELSGNVVSLQEVLADKRSRGAFGEVQLAALVRNVMPESGFALQHTLSNDKVADCMLFLPPPTGNVAIDAKFPLESYRRMTDVSVGETERQLAERQFKQDIRKHLQDIASKYIIPGETSDGAVMFIPAEAVFAEIQAHHADLVDEAQAARVWMVSPTTLMAILNTARAVLKDEATRKQVHVIQEHLSELARDFARFQKRMDNLARHIQQANRDVDDVHVSARKIVDRFQRIENAEIEHDKPALSAVDNGELSANKR